MPVTIFFINSFPHFIFYSRLKNTTALFQNVGSEKNFIDLHNLEKAVQWHGTGGGTVNDIKNRIKKAQSDSAELEQLLGDYLPLLKKQAGAAASPLLDYEDRLSLAMLTFVSCVRQYTENRGSFISFFSVCFHNRINDEIRRQNRYLKSIQPPGSDAAELEAAAGKASLEAYDREQERLSLCEEIDRLSEAIGVYGVVWKDLPRICPKQARAKATCRQLATAVLLNPEFHTMFFEQKKLPQAQLASALFISPKTIEKHRKYIVTLIILLSGDYPGIRAFLPQYREVIPIEDGNYH